MRTARWLSAVVAAGAMIGVAACGGDNSSSSSSTTAVGTTAAPTSAAGTAAPAAGGGGATTTVTPQKADPSKPPVVVGFHNLEGGALSLPEIRQAFESGMNYVNEELGGINGRPMKAEICKLDVTPESSVNCANQFVEKNVVVAVQGVDVAADAALPIWGQAGLVDIAFAGFTPGLNASRGKAFVTLFDTRDAAAQTLIMYQKLGDKKLALAAQDLPAAKQYFDTLTKPLADKLGLQVQPFYYSNTTDWTSFAATMLSTNPDAIDFGAATDEVCLASIPAIRNAGFKGNLHESSCSEYVDKLSPDLIDGIINHNEFYYPTFTAIPAKPQHDLDIFQRYMKRDVPGLKSIVYGELGFHIAVQAADMLRQVQGDITPQTVAKAMPTTKGPMFFRDTGYDCSQNYWPPDSAACSAGVLYTRTTKDRKKEPMDLNPIDSSSLRPKA